MRHRVKGKKLNRDRAGRLGLKRSLTLNLIEHGKITTTLPKAKYVKPFAEKLLTKAREGSLASHRLVISRLGNKPQAAKRLREHWAPKFDKVPGGYLRIIKLGPRKNDGAEEVKLEFAVTRKGKDTIVDNDQDKPKAKDKDKNSDKDKSKGKS